ncbi:MAG: hypothetical protein IJ309_07785 [Clostridia bacterium]|nr:hypothetical protein [Clostridia bacterium]MBQ7907850.1 hypothetical protein [Clostridia bacterium]
MTKITKKLMELECRIKALENAVKQASSAEIGTTQDQITYKEVLEEWLNGKKTT